jgi:hypothetical protein
MFYGLMNNTSENFKIFLYVFHDPEYLSGIDLDDRGFKYRQALGIFSSPPIPAGAHKPATQCVWWALSLGVKRLGRETDHSPPSSAEVKNARSYTSTSQYAFMYWCWVKAQG